MDLNPGDSADVRFPPRSKRLTARFLRAEPNGDLTFVHPRNGGLRTVHPEQVSARPAKRGTKPAPAG